MRMCDCNMDSEEFLLMMIITVMPRQYLWPRLCVWIPSPQYNVQSGFNWLKPLSVSQLERITPEQQCRGWADLDSHVVLTCIIMASYNFYDRVGPVWVVAPGGTPTSSSPPLHTPPQTKQRKPFICCFITINMPGSRERLGNDCTV